MTHFGVLNHYFPSITPGELTLDNFLEKLKLVRKMLGQDDDKPETALDPDTWFQRAMEGSIQPEDESKVVKYDEKEVARKRQEIALKKMGLL